MEPEGLPPSTRHAEQGPDVLVVVVAGHDADHVLLHPVEPLGGHHHLVLVAGVGGGEDGVPVTRGRPHHGDRPVAALQPHLRLVDQERRHRPGELAPVRTEDGQGSTSQPAEEIRVSIEGNNSDRDSHLDAGVTAGAGVGEEGEGGGLRGEGDVPPDESHAGIVSDREDLHQGLLLHL